MITAKKLLRFVVYSTLVTFFAFISTLLFGQRKQEGGYTHQAPLLVPTASADLPWTGGGDSGGGGGDCGSSGGGDCGSGGSS